MFEDNASGIAAVVFGRDVKPAAALKGGFWNDDKDAELRRLYDAGLPYSKIGAGMGITKCAALGRAKRLGFPIRYDWRIGMRLTDEDRRERHIKRCRAYNKRRRELRDVLTAAGKSRAVNRVQQRHVKQPAEQIAAEANPLHVSLIDLTPNVCRWPYGDGPFTFCGQHQHGKSSYCEPHFRLSCREAVAE